MVPSISEIATFQEEGVHSLLSGNLADVCPVGAIREEPPERGKS